MLDQSQPGMDWFCWSDFRVVFCYQFIPCSFSLTFLTMMGDELTKTGSQFTRPQTEAELSLGGATPNGVLTSWNCCMPMARLFFSRLWFIPVTLYYALAGAQRATDHYQSHTVSAIFICMHVCLHTHNTTRIHKMHIETSTNIHRLSQNHSGKYKYT